MEPGEYQTLFELEENHWWFKGLRKILLDTLSRVSMRRHPVEWVADIGCGTGGHLKAIKERFHCNAVGCDLSPYTVTFLKKRGLDREICLGSANSIPFRSEKFDQVVCMDVLECDAVWERVALNELARIVAKDGCLVILVPAFMWLKSPEHHAAVHASRRYTKGSICKLLETSGFRIRWSTYLFPTLFPLVVVYRLIQKIKYSNSPNPQSEVRHVPGWLNAFFYFIVTAESYLLEWITFWWGSSILVVADKVAYDQ